MSILSNLLINIGHPTPNSNFGEILFQTRQVDFKDPL